MWRSVCLWTAGISLLLQASHQGVYQRTLLKELMKDYSALERPVANDTQPLTVYFTLSLMQIMDVDEKNQVITTNIWLQMYWYDCYLRWNQSDYPGVKNLRFRADQVWTPDILLYNSANEDFDSTFHTNVLVNSSGYCQWLPPGIFLSSCKIDVRWFPFDIQTCALKFGSWSYDGWLLDLQLMDADISGYLPNGEWDLVGVPGSRNEIFYNCCKEPYPDVTFHITMRRRTLYYALNLLIPCVLLSTMSLLVFLLPADSGEKISLGQYFASTMIIVGLSVVATVFVLQYHHHDPSGGKMPRWVRVLVLKWCAWFLRLKKPGGEPEVRPQCAPSLLSCSSGSEPASPPGHACPANGNPLYVGFHGLEGLHPPPAVKPDVFYPRAEYPGMSGPASEPGDPQLQQILEEVQYIADRSREQDAGELACNEWKFAATVIDRLCLVAFAVFNIICTISILMSAPNFVEAISKDFI
ncbi:neuronal acetylcholine receptor subunit alpha-7-like isoform X2 [Rhinatrema bivittatum]|uniref:neuronal acetylcholine receptor subunit alpha-7-like isoform X2 n=1 Tax=Rhinatrema bivittatum TaxID=194408 RepID=UPI00112D0E4C|nr:neuronal acetylcholine receptor subunit alpha-7-like isoform X2 [Rhinatrema bivittatum]